MAVQLVREVAAKEQLRKVKSVLLVILIFFTAEISSAQKNIDKLLEQYNTRSIPYISVEELKMSSEKYQILDTRKLEEYQVSHIPNAIWVGENINDSLINTLNLSTEKPLVVYCSVGIRSEAYGEQLKAKGYKNIQNLYGSIFAWKDAGYPVLDSLNSETEQVHVFSKVWGKYLKTGEKVY